MIWPNSNIMVSSINRVKFSAVLLTVFFASFLGAQTVTKVFDQSYAKASEVSLKQSRGPLSVFPSTDGKIRVVTEMSVEARSREDAEAFLAKMETEVSAAANRLTIKTGVADVKNWSQNNGRLRVVFRDGTKFSEMKDFEVTSTLYLPATELLKLETRFERIQIDPKVRIKNLDLTLHNAKLRGGSIAGNLKLDMRFGEIALENVGGSITGKLHDTKGDFGDVGDVDLESRFSKLKMGNMKSLKMNSHNDRLEAKTIMGRIDIDDRFGTYILAGTGNAKVKSHNGTFSIESGGEYTIESRFGNFDFDRIDDLIIRDNHNVEYDIKTLGSVEGEGRFTTISVDHLHHSAELKMYNGSFKAANVDPKFRGVALEGAFYKLDLDFEKPTEYRVFADLKFGGHRLPGNLVTIKNIKDHSDVELELKTQNASADSPAIRVKGQNVKFYID